MFNLYFQDRLPFHDVFIHAMIQDGHGQKMSKSLGNGVDPADIIDSHGADAMRFTLASMTTQTQDVRLPVDLVSPHTGETFTPKYVTTSTGYKVAAPIQDDPTAPGTQCVSSYGVATGEAVPTEAIPAARNTSEKFDFGRNFANKVWNAFRFALARLEEHSPDPASRAVPAPEVDGAQPPENSAETGSRQVGSPGSLDSLADRWILGRLARASADAGQQLRDYDFAGYTTTLYDFFWRDLCDWYIEAVKPTLGQSAAQRATLAACLDASLRLLHPVMPFITERLWEALNAAAPGDRSMLDIGVRLPLSLAESPTLLMTTRWPRIDSSLIDEEPQQDFEWVQELVGKLREVRATHKAPPRQRLEVSAAMSGPDATRTLEHGHLIETLGVCTLRDVGPGVERPADAAAAVVGDAELFVHGLIDRDAETARLTKRRDELTAQIANLEKRLSNTSYIEKAPPHLVQETRDSLAAAVREFEAVTGQLDAV